MTDSQLEQLILDTIRSWIIAEKTGSIGDCLREFGQTVRRKTAHAAKLEVLRDLRGKLYFGGYETWMVDEMIASLETEAAEPAKEEP